jgi:hypothetical protein
MIIRYKLCRAIRRPDALLGPSTLRVPLLKRPSRRRWAQCTYDAFLTQTTRALIGIQIATFPPQRGFHLCCAIATAGPSSRPAAIAAFHPFHPSKGRPVFFQVPNSASIVVLYRRRFRLLCRKYCYLVLWCPGSKRYIGRSPHALVLRNCIDIVLYCQEEDIAALHGQLFQNRTRCSSDGGRYEAWWRWIDFDCET